jgi:hypothetical protein
MVDGLSFAVVHVVGYEYFNELTASSQYPRDLLGIGGNGNSFGNSSFDFFKGITSLAKHILDAHGQQPIMELGDERHWIFKNCTVRALSTPDFAGTTPREFWLPRRQPELSFIGTALSSRNRSEAR